MERPICYHDVPITTSDRFRRNLGRVKLKLSVCVRQTPLKPPANLVLKRCPVPATRSTLIGKSSAVPQVLNFSSGLMC
jgi:hypothetical protein